MYSEERIGDAAAFTGCLTSWSGIEPALIWTSRLSRAKIPYILCGQIRLWFYRVLQSTICDVSGSLLFIIVNTVELWLSSSPQWQDYRAPACPGSVAGVTRSGHRSGDARIMRDSRTTIQITIDTLGSTNSLTSQQTQNICITFIQCWTNVEDVGPTLYKCYANVFRLLGSPIAHNTGTIWL